jgi:hypothetical protein
MMVKSCININSNNLIKSSKKTISWAKKLEDIKIISPCKKCIEKNENINNTEIIDKNNDFQDILKLKINKLRIQIQAEIDIERKKYLQEKFDLYISKINHNNYNNCNKENIFISIYD